MGLFVAAKEETVEETFLFLPVSLGVVTGVLGVCGLLSRGSRCEDAREIE